MINFLLYTWESEQDAPDIYKMTSRLGSQCPCPRNLSGSGKNKEKWVFPQPLAPAAHTECQPLTPQPETAPLILNEFSLVWLPQVLFAVQNKRLHKQLTYCIFWTYATINELRCWLWLIFDSLRSLWNICFSFLPSAAFKWCLYSPSARTGVWAASTSGLYELPGSTVNSKMSSDSGDQRGCEEENPSLLAWIQQLHNKLSLPAPSKGLSASRKGRETFKQHLGAWAAVVWAHS